MLVKKDESQKKKNNNNGNKRASHEQAKERSAKECLPNSNAGMITSKTDAMEADSKAQLQDPSFRGENPCTLAVFLSNLEEPELSAVNGSREPPNC